MPSPFPGMNPYLEQAGVWNDFHNSFIPALRDELARQLAPAFIVRIDQHLYVHEWANPFARGDTVVLNGMGNRPATDVLTVTAPVEVRIGAPPVDEERVAFLEISTRDRKRVVTIVELLSPANKYSGPDRASFVDRRNVLLNRAVHYLEIDLLRGGPRMPIHDMPPCDYGVLLSRFDRRPRGEFWPIRLRDPLPTIPVPVLAPALDAVVNLKAVIDRVYDGARYESSIYEGYPEPELSKSDAAWAAQFVPARPA